MILIDTIPFDPRIIESTDNGIMKIEGVFQRVDVKNANGRVYPRKIWERLLAEKSPLAERMGARAVIGHLEHPQDGVTDLRKGAIIITGLSLDEKGQVIGKAEILDTPDGKIVQEYVRKKVRIGISSRGSGTVGSDGRVSDDYNAESFDIVYNPSTPGAYPEAVAESNRTVAANKPDKENVMEGLERFQLMEVNLKPLLEQKVDGLAPFQIADLSGKLLENSVKLGALATENPALVGAIEEAQKRISEKRTALNAAGSAPKELDEQELSAVESLIEQATVKVEETREEAEKVKAQLDEVKKENETLKAKTEELTEDGEEVESEAEETIAASEELFEAQAKKLVEATERVEMLEEKLAAAVSLISRLVAERKGSDDLAEQIAAAIAEVVEAEPRLKEAVDMLADCTTPDEVYEKADEMLTEIQESVRKPTRRPPALEQLDEEIRSKRASRQSIFEDADGEDLSSEKDVSEGEFEPESDKRLMEHKGRRLTLGAINSLKNNPVNG